MGRAILQLRVTSGKSHTEVRSQIEKSSFVAKALGHGLTAIDYAVDSRNPDRATLMLTMTDVEPAEGLARECHGLASEVGCIELTATPTVVVDPRRQ